MVETTNNSFDISEEDLASFTQECFAIAEEWAEDQEQIVRIHAYLNNPAVRKIVEENQQK